MAKTPAKTTAKPQAPAVGKDPRGAAPEQTTTAAAADEELKPRARTRVAEEPVDEQVTVVVPRAFRLTVAGKTDPIHYEPGIYEMPRSHAEHWYSAHHGVEIK
jgi:hypothetical protein